MSATGGAGETDDDGDGGDYETAQATLQTAVPEAAETVRELLDAEDDRVRLQAAKTILDRGGLVPGKRRTAMNARKMVGGKGSGDDGDRLDNLLR